MDARGHRITVTGNTPAAGMTAVGQRTGRRGAKRSAAEAAIEPTVEPNGAERPALSLVPPTLPVDELEDDVNATLELEEVAGPDDKIAVSTAERIKRARTASQRVVFGQPINRIYMAGVGVLLVAALIAAMFAIRGNLLAAQQPVPTPTVQLVQATPTGFGDPTATIPPKPTDVPVVIPTDRLVPQGWAQVTGTGSALIVRQEPSRESGRVARLTDGSRVHILEGPHDAGGITWWRVDQFDPNDPGKSGWCSGQFLAPIPPP
jgi:hypothetical protein